MNKEFIPYNQALALKELGFDEGCLRMYRKDLLSQLPPVFCDIVYWHSPDGAMKINDYNWIKAPLYQQAFRWFREKYDLWHQIYRDGYAEHNIVYQVWSNKGMKSFKFESKETSYEQAELACLDKLIEIVKK